MTPQGVSFFERKIRITKIKNILTHRSAAQAGSNDEKLEIENLVGLAL